MHLALQLSSGKWCVSLVSTCANNCFLARLLSLQSLDRLPLPHLTQSQCYEGIILDFEKWAAFHQDWTLSLSSPVRKSWPQEENRDVALLINYRIEFQWGISKTYTSMKQRHPTGVATHTTHIWSRTCSITTHLHLCRLQLCLLSSPLRSGLTTIFHTFPFILPDTFLNLFLPADTSSPLCNCGRNHYGW